MIIIRLFRFKLPTYSAALIWTQSMLDGHTVQRCTAIHKACPVVGRPGLHCIRCGQAVVMMVYACHTKWIVCCGHNRSLTKTTRWTPYRLGSDTIENRSGILAYYYFDVLPPLSTIPVLCLVSALYSNT